MKHLSRFFSALPKRLIAGFAALIAVLVLPLATLSAANVRMEGSLGVANVTRGDTRYTESTSASYDEVVKVQLYYHNQENPDSGKIANDVRVKINVPTAAGANQTISGSISSPDIDTIQDSVAVTLDRADAYLEYIPGSANWKHNKGTNENVQIVEEKISDEVVYGGTGIVLEDAKPCFNFDATINILVRVRVPGVKIVKQSTVKGSGQAWSNNNTAKPGETLTYMLTYQNTGNTTQKNVVIRDNLPPSLTYVPGTTYLINSTNPNGVKYDSDNITNGGIVIGDYAPGAGAYIKFDVKIPAADKLACGITEYRNVGIARPEGMNEYYNTSITKVDRKCDEQPKKPLCDLLELKKLDGRKVSATVKYTANGATFKNVTFNWGDNTTALVTNNTTAEHTYAADGTYTVSASVRFTVNGSDQVVTSENCAQKVTFGPTETPKDLPKTGAGSLIGLFTATTVAGGVAHNVVSRRRAER